MKRHIRYVSHPTKYPAGRLVSLDVELTERCNNNCVHCYINLPADDQVAKRREMSTRQVGDVLQQAAALGCLEVRFTGGEPLLRDDFEEVYLTARRLGLRTIIATNARCLTPRLVKTFVEVPPLQPLEVSVYGASQTSYEQVTRVPGSYVEFTRGIRLLLEYEVPFRFKTVLLSTNQAEVEKTEAWARSLSEALEPVTVTSLLELRARHDDPSKDRLIRSLRLSPTEVAAFAARDQGAFKEVAEAFSKEFMGPPGARLFRCGAGANASVDAYGRVQPCLRLRAPQFAFDLSSVSLAEALERYRLLAEIRAQDPDYLRRCAVCPLHGFCRQCPAWSFSEAGVLDAPVEYLCEVAHAEAQLLGWLRPGEQAWKIKFLGTNVDIEKK